MPEPVPAWWARRQSSRRSAVPYAVGQYREAWAYYPQLVRQYRPEYNFGIVLSQIPPGADVFLCWECELGHVFVATPDEQRSRPGGPRRRRSAWCPQCTEQATPTRVPGMPFLPSLDVAAYRPGADVGAPARPSPTRARRGRAADGLPAPSGGPAPAWLPARPASAAPAAPAAPAASAASAAWPASPASPASAAWPASAAPSAAAARARPATLGSPPPGAPAPPAPRRAVAPPTARLAAVAAASARPARPARRPKPVCAKTPPLPAGEPFASSCAPAPASAVEGTLRAGLAELLEFTPGLTAIRLAAPFFDHLEAWPDIVLPELRVAIEYDTTGRHGLEHVGRREDADRRKDRLTRAVGWEVIRIRTGRLQPLGPHDIMASGASKATLARLLDELRAIRGDLLVDCYLR